MGDKAYEIAKTLKSNTFSSVYPNTLSKLPIVVTSEGIFINGIEVKDDIIPEDGVIYTDNLQVIKDRVLESGDPDSNPINENTIIKYMIKKHKIYPVKKFHYDDTWYVHKCSDTDPESSFGILKFNNIPYRSFEKLLNKKSFICRMDQLMFNGLAEPFMVFINNKFVNWNAIDIVFDCDDSYLLLHGREYNYFNLVNAEINIIILPYKVEFIGEESDYIWNTYLDMFTRYMQDSLHTDSDSNIIISVPDMYSIYKYKGMIYNVGSWLYSQLRMEYLGLLSKDRVDKLKKITLNKYTYDEAGNIIETKSTRFNALDKDSYNINIYENICNESYEDIQNNEIFKFDNNGILSSSGSNVISLFDTTVEVDTVENNIVEISTKYDKTLFRENYIVFKNGLLDAKCKMKLYCGNVAYIDDDDAEYTIKVFKPLEVSKLCKLDSDMHTSYLKRISNWIIDGNNKEIYKLINSEGENYLDYKYLDNVSYNTNCENAINKIMEFNPLLLNGLTKASVISKTISGFDIKYTFIKIGPNNYKMGITIPRYKYDDHETYILVFINGLLIDRYDEMQVSANYFFIPTDDYIEETSTIEILYFTHCDNNEIHFNFTKNMVDNKLEATDSKDFLKCNLFEEYIRKEDIKIFADYPDSILVYKDLIDKTEDIAFNVSCRNADGDLLIFRQVINDDLFNDLDTLDKMLAVVPNSGIVPKMKYQQQELPKSKVEEDNEIIDNIMDITESTIPSKEARVNNFTAVSSRKFIYQRLYVDQKAYRIKLDKRFRYCDNQKQYVIFINGRRLEDFSFLVTIPKYSRPFWGMYLYLSRFVNPSDRIEIFYLPEEMYNINTDYEMVNLNDSGYVSIKRSLLNVPLDPKFYLFFINGKKIPASDIIPIDSYTVRIKKDPTSLKRLNINPIYRSSDYRIIDYMKSNILSKYDKYILDIKNLDTNNTVLDRLFNAYIKLSDIEEDIIKRNVGKIAIINEIVRDFWVTSGYRYNEEPFIYDYELDEIITKDTNGNIILPALDANPYINIQKNDIRLAFITSSIPLNQVYGNIINGITFNWQFTNNLNGGVINITSQHVNTIDLGTETREYSYEKDISSDTDFKFIFNTGSESIVKDMNVRFYNNVYYGSVDEDALQDFEMNKYTLLDSLMAIVPKDGKIPYSSQQDAENESLTIVAKDNIIITNITTSDEINIPTNSFNELSYSIYSIDMEENIKYSGNHIEVVKEYHTSEDLNDLLNNESIMNSVAQDTPTLDFNKYKIGSNNYFVYAAPKRIVYNNDGKMIVKFIMPDLDDRDLIDYGKDDHTTPIYTDGTFDEHNCLVKLDKCEMICLGEFEHKNKYGFVETYVIWRSNGFFTRKYDDYLFNMRVMSEDDFMEYAKPSLNEDILSSFVSVNTSSLTGKENNKKITIQIKK